MSVIVPANAAAAPSPLAALAAGGLCSTAALAAGAPVDTSIVLPASPDAPTDIPKAIVDRAVFIAHWRHHSTDAQAVESLIQDLFLMAGAGNLLPQLTAQVRQRIPLEVMEDRVQHPLDEIVHVYFDTALAIPDLVPFVPAVWDALNAGIPRDDITVDSSLLVAQSARRFDLGERMLQSAPEFMVAVHDCARQNQAFATQYDTLHAQALGASIRDSAAAILQKNAELGLPTLFVQSIQPDGTAKLSLTQLRAFGDGSVDDLDAIMDSVLATVKTIDQKQTDIVAFKKDEQKQEEAKKLAKEKAEATEKQFKKAEATINATAIILSQLDAKLAKDFKTVTSSYLGIVKSVNEWLEATAGDGAFDKIFSFSTVIMTGNVLDGVLKIASIFGEGKPTPEQQILEQIGKLRQQVEKLRQEMHARFDRIDAQLNTIFTTMQERFNQIDVQLGKINGNIRDMQRSLIELDLRLSQFERNNFELLNVLGRRPLLDAINSGLDYQRITGSPMPFQPEFVGFERTFHTWGTVHAFDPLNTGPSQRDFSDGALFRELTTFPLDTNLNYLNGWLAAHGLPTIATGMLASPRDWLLASRAYTQLGAEWPEHMARIDAAELPKLTAVGQQIEDAITKITAPTTVNAAGDSIFDVVTTLYSGKLTQLNTGLQQIEATFLQELQASLLDPAVPFDLFGGTEQELHKSAGSSELWIPPGYTKIELDDPLSFTPILLPVPLSIQNLVSLEKHQNLSELLKLSSPQTRITMQVVEENRQNFPCPIGTKPKDCSASAHVTVTVDLHFGSLVWKTFVYDMGTVVMSKIETAIEFVSRTWATKMAEFDVNAVVVPPTPDQQAQIDSRFLNLKGALDNRLQQDQQVLYARMTDQMDSGTLHPLMVEIAGFKALIDAFTSLGLPRAVENDEFLHAILFGEQRIFDDVLIVNTFALSATQPITGPALLVNQRPLLMERSAARVQLYIELVDGYLAAIAAGQPVAAASVTAATDGYVEGADYLTNARRALDLTVRIARIPRPQTPETPTPPGPTPPGPMPPGPTPPGPVPPNGTLQVYLPLVDR
jgi:hypothetical protein